MLTVSGSKSQPGSGVPAFAFANRSVNFVAAPSATFLQKSGPIAALKVPGSHSSKATTCAILGGSSPCVPPANIKPPANTKPPASKPNFATVVFIMVLLPSCSEIVLPSRLSFTFMAILLSYSFGPEPKLGPAGLTDDRAVVCGDPACRDLGLHVHGFSPFLEFWADLDRGPSRRSRPMG